MKKITKKLLGMLLALAMVLTMIPAMGTTVFAAEDTSLTDLSIKVAGSSDNIIENFDSSISTYRVEVPWSTGKTQISVVATTSDDSNFCIQYNRTKTALTYTGLVASGGSLTVNECWPDKYATEELTIKVLAAKSADAQVYATITIVRQKTPGIQAAGLIDVIGTVTVESGDAIKAAREAYDALTDEEKAKVDNYATLTAAETTYFNLTHTHSLVATEAKDATCTEAGNTAYWTCSGCNKYFSDAEAVTEIAENSWVITAKGHKLTETAATEPTTTASGNTAYWTCEYCGKYFSDAEGTTEIEENSWIILNAAQNTEKLITALPKTVTLDDKAQIEAARAAYDGLSDEEKATVSEADVAKLEAAEAKLETAQAKADKAAAEEAKTKAETDKAAAEEAKTKAETDKAAAEEAKTKAETDKAAAEEAKTKAEAAQAKAEKEAKAAKLAQKSAEAKTYTVSGLKVTSKSKKLTVTYKKNAKVNGYQVCYKLKTAKKFSTLKTTTAVKVTSKKLKKGKVYQVKVRPYTNVNGKKVYGQWTAVKSVKCK